MSGAWAERFVMLVGLEIFWLARISPTVGSVGRGPCVIVRNDLSDGSEIQDVLTPVATAGDLYGSDKSFLASVLDVSSVNVTDDELKAIISAERTSPIIIDFYASWCGPCLNLEPVIEQLAVEYGEDIRFLRVNFNTEHVVSDQMEIRCIPTLVFVSKDVHKRPIWTEGFYPKDYIRNIIETEILV